MNKSQIMIEYLKTCPYIQNESLFFNFGTVENNAHQMVTRSDNVQLQKPYVDGSILKQYTFYIDSFKAIAYNPVIDGFSDENIEDFQSAEKLIEWIEEQNDLRNFPDFGEDCIIDEMYSQTARPELLFVDTSTTPQTAIYRITIKIIYLDTSKTLK